MKNGSNLQLFFSTVIGAERTTDENFEDKQTSDDIGPPDPRSIFGVGVSGDHHPTSALCRLFLTQRVTSWVDFLVWFACRPS